MKTAMQEHIDWLKSTLEICKEHSTPLINCLKLCISDAESKLEMEKQQIIDAYINCKREYVISIDCYPPQFVLNEATEYYTQTFKSE